MAPSSSNPRITPSPTTADRIECRDDFLPFALPEFGEEEISEVIDTLKSGWWTTGPKTRKFEDEFADYVGVRHAIAVNSATAGLHLALEALGIGPGDKVITPTYTFTATAEVARYLGADVLLTDVDSRTLNLDLRQVRTLLQRNERVKAIVPVHFGGQACDMATLMNLAREYDVRVVEDAAHALPATSGGNTIGGIGDITVFSFYVTKPVATGEGGMVTTNDEAHARRIRTMRLHGISRDVFSRYTEPRPSWYYEVVAPGFKYNLTDLASSLGLHQLRKADRFQQKRKWIAEQYQEAFAGLPLQLPIQASDADIHAWHLYVIRLLDEARVTRDEFIEELYRRGIGTSVHFIPLHVHPYWRDRYDFHPEQFPAALDAYHRAVSLPIYSRMSEADVLRVIRAVMEILD